MMSRFGLLDVAFTETLQFLNNKWRMKVLRYFPKSKLSTPINNSNYEYSLFYATLCMYPRLDGGVLKLMFIRPKQLLHNSVFEALNGKSKIAQHAAVAAVISFCNDSFVLAQTQLNAILNAFDQA